jgi:hypothetical protein
MNEPGTLPTRQIGKLGELLVQYKLLKYGIESAHLTTDSGIDLVAYSLGGKRPITIQVKANLKPKPGGGRGKPTLDWWVPDHSPAEIFAFVDASKNQVWLFTKLELKRMAQQHSGGRYHFYMYTDPVLKPGNQKKATHMNDFERYRLESRITELF